jgi:hypothetical protein
MVGSVMSNVGIELPCAGSILAEGTIQDESYSIKVMRGISCYA